MQPSTNESTANQIIKKIFLIIIGSGLVTNALYIYGLSYYQGWLSNLGFSYELFPIEWEESVLWTYFASIESGADSYAYLTNMSITLILTIVFVVYAITRIWSLQYQKEQVIEEKIKCNKCEKIYLALKSFHVKCLKYRAYKACAHFLKWFLITEQAIWAFAASYFALVVLFVFPVLAFIWIYFPLVGYSHGERVAKERLDFYQDNLCKAHNNNWNQCISIPTNGIKQKNLPEYVTGRLVIKKENLLGLITED